jgi:uncharacterized protein
MIASAARACAPLPLACLILVSMIGSLSGQAQQSGGGTSAEYRAQVEEWRKRREAALKADWGWLTVSGLFWLKEGANTIGSAPGSDILLPAGAPERFGTLRLVGSKAEFTTDDSNVLLNGKPVRKSEIRHADSGAADVLSSGHFQLLLLKRGDRFALRLKDNESEARKEFKGLNWFPIEEQWKVQGKLTRFPSPTTLVFDTAVGVKEELESPGIVEFSYGGQVYKLQAAKEGDRLFFVIRDKTSGRSTYGASRFLYASLRDDGTVELDFNKAQNPPCAFTPYATCPLPPPQNRLPLAITAGEKTYEAEGH